MKGTMNMKSNFNQFCYKSLLLVVGIVLSCNNIWGCGNSYFAKVECAVTPTAAGVVYGQASTNDSHRYSYAGQYDQDHTMGWVYWGSNKPYDFELGENSHSDGYFLLYWCAEADMNANKTAAKSGATLVKKSSGKDFATVVLNTATNPGSDNAKSYKYYAVYAELNPQEVSVIAPFENCEPTLQSRDIKVSHVNAGTVSVSVSGEGFTVSPASFTSTSTEQETTITVTYQSPLASGERTATVTLTSNQKDWGNGDIKTSFTLKSVDCKPVFTWDNIEPLKQNNTRSNFVRINNESQTITLSLVNTSDASLVDYTGTSVHAKVVADKTTKTVRFKAQVSAAGGYAAGDSEADLVISDKNAQQIAWPSSGLLSALSEDINADVLDAFAYPLVAGDEVGNISYSIADASIAEIVVVGGKQVLHPLKEGNTTITATAAETNDCAAFSVQKTIKVGKATACVSYLIDDDSSKKVYYKVDNYGTETKTYAEYASTAAGNVLQFTMTGAKEGTTYHSVTVWGAVSGSSTLVKLSGEDGDEFKLTGSETEHSFSVNVASNMRFFRFAIKPNGGKQEATGRIKSVKLSQATYLYATDENSTEQYNDVSDNIDLNFYESYQKTINVYFSNQPSLVVTSNNPHVIVTNTEFEAGCGNAGQFKVTYKVEAGATPIVNEPAVITIKNLDGTTNPAQPITINLTLNVHAGKTYYFVQSTEGNWAEPTHWSLSSHGSPQGIDGSLPAKNNPVVIQGNATLKMPAEVYSLTMDGGTLTIDSLAGLSVYDGAISGTTTSNLILKASEANGNSYIRVIPGAQKTPVNATVEFFSKAIHMVKDNQPDKDATWQYIGSPLTAESCPNAQDLFYQCGLSKYDPATKKWSDVGGYEKMQPFYGYSFTQPDEKITRSYWGTLNEFKNHSVSFSGVAGKSVMVANSFSAPITVANFTDADLDGFEKTLYLFNTGSWNEWQQQMLEGNKSVVDWADITDISKLLAGQYISVPINSAKWIDGINNLTIPSMQGFTLFAETANPTITFNYANLVWNKSVVPYPVPMFAPARHKQEIDTKPQSLDDINARIQMTVMGDGQMDAICLLEADGFSSSYEDGYDAKKRFPSSSVPYLYTSESAGELMVSCRDDLNGLVLGFDTPDRTNDTTLTYTLSFFSVLGDEYYLHDNVTNWDVLMSEGVTYTFTAPAGCYNPARFVVGTSPRGVVTELNDDLLDKDIRIWQRDELLCAAVSTNAAHTLTLYDMQGHLIAEQNFTNACTYDMSNLPNGVYMAMVGDQSLKVVR